MKLKKIVTLMSIGMLATGCAEMHSEQYKSTKSITEHNLDKISKIREAAVDKVIAGTTLKDFFVDTNPVKIKVNDDLKLPSSYPSTVRVYSALPETESDLATRLITDYNIKIKFSRLIPKPRDDSSSDDGGFNDDNGASNGNNSASNGNNSASNYDNSASNYDNSASNDDNGASNNDGDMVRPDDTRSGGNDSKAGGMGNDGLVVFGLAPLDKTVKDLVKPIDYNGSIKGLMDLIASDRGLDWKYDEDTDTFIFYDLDTETFSLIDNSGKSKMSLDMKTAVAGDAGKSSANTNQSSGTSSSYDNWGSVVKTVTALIGANGKYSTNQGQGQIVVTDTKENLARIKRVVDNMNAQSGIQVVMDVTFLKFSLNKSSSFGTDLSSLSASDIIGGAVSAEGGSGTIDPKTTTGSLYKLNFNKAGVSSMVHALSKIGTINYKFSDEIISLNNQLMPYQRTIDESYISSITSTTDDKGVETKTPVVAVRKTGISSSLLSRVIGDRVKLNGYITMARALSTARDAASGVMLPTDLSENSPINSIIDNGKTRIVSVKEVDESKANSSGIGSTNTLPIGGSEDTSTDREITVVLVTPYIVK